MRGTVAKRLRRAARAEFHGLTAYSARRQREHYRGLKYDFRYARERVH